MPDEQRLPDVAAASTARTRRVPRLVATRLIDAVAPPDPEPPGPAQVEVRVEAVAICGSDVAAYEGRHPRIRPPVVLGHEMAGVVERVGKGVSVIGEGTRVAVSPTRGCGRCRMCREGRENICGQYRVVGESSKHPGGLAGYVTVAADHVHALPDRVGFDEGALVQPLAVGLHAVRDRGAVSAGDMVLVVGAGPIGVATMLFAKRAGATVVVSELRGDRRAIAAALGSDRTVDSGETDVPELVRSLTDGRGADVAFEAAGGQTTGSWDTAFASTAPGGRVVVLGSFSARTADLPIGVLKSSEIDVRGSQAHPDCFDEVIVAIADGSIPAARLITHRFAFSELAAALDLLADPRAGAMKVCLLPD